MNAQTSIKKDLDMATAAKIEDTSIAANDIVVAVTQSPQLVLLDQAKFDQFYERMKAETDKLEPDVSTQKGRDEIRSMAFRVTKTKTAIDAAAKQLTEDWRSKTASVNAQRRVIVDQLDALAEEVRKPLTEWEEAEKARVAECDATIARIVAAATVTIEDTAASVRQRGSDIWNESIEEERFGDLFGRAISAKEQTVATLQAAMARLTQEEADRAELERLRAENEAREAREHEEREAREQAEREAEQARLAEERRAAAERAEQERIATAAREAEERARREEQERHEAELAAERRRAEEAERAAQAERDRAAAAEAARIAEEERIAAETAKRQADQEHRTRVKTTAKTAIMSCGADEETARKIVVAIMAGEVPNVRLEF